MLHGSVPSSTFARLGASTMSTPLDDRSDVGRATTLSFTDDFAPTSAKDWTETIKADLRGTPIERLDWHSVDGITLHPFYRGEDLDTFIHLTTDPLPLIPEKRPDVPRAEPDGYKPSAGHESAGHRWQICQEIATRAPKDAATQAKAVLEGGADAVGLHIATTRDRDRSGHEIKINTPGDLGTALQHVYLNAAPVHLSARPGSLSPALLVPELARLLRRTYENDGDVLGGTVTYDPIAALACGDVRHPATAFDLATDVIKEAAGLPLRSLAVDARAYHEAGTSAVQELAFMLAALTETFDQCTERGLSVDTLCSALHVVTAVDTSFFVEIGKLRAVRLLVARVLNGFIQSAPGSTSDAPAIHPDSVFVQVHTSGRTQTMYGTYVNMIRNTTEAASAIIGGCDVLTVTPFDNAFKDPSDFSNRIARNTQLILRHESHLDQVTDPSAGSYYIEAVTSELVSKAWSLFQEMEADGGMLTALKQGNIAERISATRSKRTERVDRRKHVLVGTSHYPDVDETRLDDLTDDNRDMTADTDSPSDVDAEIANLAERFHADVSELAAVTAAFDQGVQLPTIAAAIESIVDADDPASIPPLSPLRLGAPYENIRLRTERYTERTGRRPTVLLAPHGPSGPRSARANFARNVLGLAGFQVVEPISFDTAEAAAEAAVDEGADIVVACSSDDTYTDYVPSLRDALTVAGSRALLVVAGPPDGVEAPVIDVADRFVHLKAPLIETLEHIQRDIGVTTFHPSS